MTRTQIVAFRWVLAAAIVIITHLAITPQQYPIIRHIYDKANHIAAFYALAFLIDFSFPATNAAIAKAMGLLGYGILIEVVQSFIPNRMASFLDVAADGMGIALYSISLPLLRHVPLLRRRWRAQS
jgi:VanZ family protein